MEIKVLASSSAGNCYWVSDGRTPLLLEAGIGLAGIRKGTGFAVSGLAGCLISHEHSDHARAAADLMKTGVDIWASGGTIEALRVTGHRKHQISAMHEFPLGTWRVLPFDAVHDAAEPLSFLLASQSDKLLYLVDSAYCRYRFDGLTVLMVECNHSAELLRQNVADGVISPELKHRIQRNHMSLERLVEMLRANDLSRVEAVYLLHLSDQNSDETAFKRRIREIIGKPVYVARK